MRYRIHIVSYREAILPCIGLYLNIGDIKLYCIRICSLYEISNTAGLCCLCPSVSLAHCLYVCLSVYMSINLFWLYSYRTEYTAKVILSNLQQVVLIMWLHHCTHLVKNINFNLYDIPIIDERTDGRTDGWMNTKWRGFR